MSLYLTLTKLSLRDVYVCPITELDLVDHLDWIPKMTSLKKLTLPELSEQSFEYLVHNCPQLSRFDVSQTSDLTERSLKTSTAVLTERPEQSLVLVLNGRAFQHMTADLISRVPPNLSFKFVE